MKRSVGRPRVRTNGKTLTVYLPGETKAQLLKLAFQQEMSVGNYITSLVNEKLTSKNETRNSTPQVTQPGKTGRFK